MGFSVIKGGRTPADEAEEIRQVASEHIVPAALELQKYAREGDLEAVRVVAHELLATLGAVISACPRPGPPRAPDVPGPTETP